MTNQPDPTPEQVSAYARYIGAHAHLPRQAVCVVCGTNYITRYAHSKFCSNRCKMRDRAQRQKESAQAGY